MLAIAELAGGEWPKRAHNGAEFIAGKAEGSQGAGLFAAFYAMCAARLEEGAIEIMIPSKEAIEFLKSFDPYWANDYRGSDGRPGEITPSKLAAFLRGYEIYPGTVHPTKRASLSPRGYVIFEGGEKWSEQWLDMMARYAPGLPHNRTLVKQKRRGRKKR